MSDLLINYCHEAPITLYSFLDDLEDDEEFIRDDTGMIYVDGEEGDYGVIEYHQNVRVEGSWTTLLVCRRVVEGGDSESWEFTPYGKEIFKEKLRGAMNQWLNTF